VGVNYTHYFSPTPNQAILDNVSVRDNFGVAAQVGVDYMLTEHWGINANVKWVEMDPHVRALLADGVTHLTGNAKLDPWLFSAGITYRFGGGSQPIFAKY
jgi:outer membrane protein